MREKRARVDNKRGEGREGKIENERREGEEKE